ncbi:phosphonate dehydrogenase PtxD [Pseudomonas aeruginosa]|uniref:phosphonate dehydrogenase PtxD n=1 Tax=Pseudomonas aeruginosa TaxID=287 RepID=UPI00106874A0|nr:phosphonate dehydrogenase PtxD [Pseudomonas aeruginosa]TED41736.1 hydroxyacid dehydrogenase [Pseudomonas aeruginosa]
MLPKLVITHRVHDEILQLLAPHCELMTNQSDTTLTREEILRRCRDAQAMMAFMPDRVDAEFLQACPELRVVGCALKGFDNFDVDACTARGVWLTFVPDLLTVPTAELAIGLAVGLGRHLRAADAFVRSGEFQGWQPQFYGTGLDNATVGILGMGAIGQAMAERLQGWGATLQYHEAKALDTQTEQRLGLRQVACSELFASSDFILLALPLNADTEHLVNAELLALVRPGALLVNPCRGSVVDEAAVLAALERGQLGGYAADVFEMEDWARADRPRLIDPALLAHPNTLFTPHIGSAVRAVRLEIERCAAQSIIQALAGARPINAANRLPQAEPAAC